MLFDKSLQTKFCVWVENLALSISIQSTVPFFFHSSHKRYTFRRTNYHFLFNNKIHAVRTFNWKKIILLLLLKYFKLWRKVGNLQGFIFLNVLMVSYSICLKSAIILFISRITEFCWDDQLNKYCRSPWLTLS
jgi:hypothetical protein